MSFIDAHHHLWDLGHRAQPWIDPVVLAPLNRTFGLDDLCPPAEAAGVTGSVLVQCINSLDETREFLALAAADRLVAGVVGWVDLEAPDVADTLAALRAGPGGSRLVGIRHQVQSEPDPDWLVRPAVLRGLAALGAAGLTFDLLVLPVQMPAALAAVTARPEVVFVLDHLAKPPIADGDLAFWESGFRVLAERPNLVAKVSGLVTEASWATWTVDDLRPVVDVALDAFGPSRLMFGSDWPVCLLAADYGQVVAVADELVLPLLSPSERDAFRSGTALSAYRLTVDAPRAGSR
jgi:L-fuconolactonase